jgi:hypothetical protein
MAHRAGGGEVVEASWFGSSNLGVVNLQGMSPRTRGFRLRKRIRYGLIRVSQAVWLAEIAHVPVPSTRHWSPYAICVATVPGPL